MTAAKSGALACAGLLLVAACSGSPGSQSSSPPTGTGGGATAAEDFLSTYVTGDGRVLRRDQGDDVVSEGQAYGMLIAELAGRPGTVRTIWAWTSKHLQRKDGLLSFHASADGTVEDPSPAADADVLTAFALLRYRGSGAGPLHRQGRRLARAVLAHETTTDHGSGPVLVAGTWAVGPPAVVDPSYWMPGVFAALGRMTGDDRWDRMSATTVQLLGESTDHGARLPPDWGRLSGGRLVATGAPDGSAPEQYGPDAQRLPLWFAHGCSSAARELAAKWWQLLAADDRSSALALAPDGSVTDGTRSPLAMLASSAAAQAAGEDDRAARLAEEARRQAHSTPTYYGDAWLALASGLRDGSLTDCG